MLLHVKQRHHVDLSVHTECKGNHGWLLWDEAYCLNLSLRTSEML